jgi:hypothetical protein
MYLLDVENQVTRKIFLATPDTPSYTSITVDVHKDQQIFGGVGSEK